MTVLIPMSTATFDAYQQAAIKDYASDNVESGRWPEEDALERSRADFAASLPQGLKTPNNFLFEIKEVDSSSAVGIVWFAIEEKHGSRTAFVYDIEIKPECRRRGHAVATFRALELLMPAHQVSSIGLHVFSQNTAAQALYRKLGYQTTGINMIKKLELG